jgi:mRNA interferase RelE/StbE
MAFRKNPRPVGNKKLKGEYQDFYRIRIGGYRVIYPIEDKIRTVDIRQIGHRKDIYR